MSVTSSDNGAIVCARCGRAVVFHRWPGGLFHELAHLGPVPLHSHPAAAMWIADAAPW